MRRDSVLLISKLDGSVLHAFDNATECGRAIGISDTGCSHCAQDRTLTWLPYFPRRKSEWGGAEYFEGKPNAPIAVIDPTRKTCLWFATRSAATRALGFKLNSLHCALSRGNGHLGRYKLVPMVSTVAWAGLIKLLEQDEPGWHFEACADFYQFEREKEQ